MILHTSLGKKSSRDTANSYSIIANVDKLGYCFITYQTIFCLHYSLYNLGSNYFPVLVVWA
jgi:hypothetical protein